MYPEIELVIDISFDATLNLFSSLNSVKYSLANVRRKYDPIQTQLLSELYCQTVDQVKTSCHFTNFSLLTFGLYVF